MGQLRRIRPFVVAALIAVATCAGAILLVGRGDSTGAAEAQRASSSPFDAEAVSLLATLRRDRRSGDELAGAPRKALRQTRDAQPGEDPGRAWRVNVAGAARPAYLWPRRNGICGSAPGGGIFCSPTDALAKKGVLLNVRGKLRRADLTYEYAHLFGIAADGIRSVQFRFKNGDTTRTPVKNNVFYASFEDLPQQLRWVYNDRIHREPTGAISPRDLAGLPR